MHFEQSTVSNRQIDEVWTFLPDSFSAARLLSVMLRGWRWSGPIGVGAQSSARGALFGCEFDLTTTITEYDAPRVIAHTGTGGPGSGRN